MICDVGPRDGLQNDPAIVAPEQRAELCRRLAAAGLRRVEAARGATVATLEPLVAALPRPMGLSRR